MYTHAPRCRDATVLARRIRVPDPPCSCPMLSGDLVARLAEFARQVAAQYECAVGMAPELLGPEAQELVREMDGPQGAP